MKRIGYTLSLLLTVVLAISLFLVGVLAWPAAVVLLAVILKGGCK